MPLLPPGLASFSSSPGTSSTTTGVKRSSSTNWIRTCMSEDGKNSNPHASRIDVYSPSYGQSYTRTLLHILLSRLWTCSVYMQYVLKSAFHFHYIPFAVCYILFPLHSIPFPSKAKDVCIIVNKTKRKKRQQFGQVSFMVCVGRCIVCLFFGFVEHLWQQIAEKTIVHSQSQSVHSCCWKKQKCKKARDRGWNKMHCRLRRSWMFASRSMQSSCHLRMNDIAVGTVVCMYMYLQSYAACFNRLSDFNDTWWELFDFSWDPALSQLF